MVDINYVVSAFTREDSEGNSKCNYACYKDEKQAQSVFDSINSEDGYASVRLAVDIKYCGKDAEYDDEYTVLAEKRL